MTTSTNLELFDADLVPGVYQHAVEAIHVRVGDWAIIGNAIRQVTSKARHGFRIRLVADEILWEMAWDSPVVQVVLS